MHARSLPKTGAQAVPLDLVPGVPRNGNDPVFREPWEAQAFAMAVMLHGRGIFTWPEWATALSAEIRAAQSAGDPDTGETYYRHWLAALEKLVIERTGIDARALAERKSAWQRAARATPHGQPIELGNAQAGQKSGEDDRQPHRPSRAPS